MRPAEIWAPITRWAPRPIGMGEVVHFDALLVMRPRPTPPCLDRVHRRMLGVPASSRADCPSGDGSRQNPRPPIMRLIASPEQEAPTRCFLWARSLEARPPCLALSLGRRGLNPPGMTEAPGLVLTNAFFSHRRRPKRPKGSKVWCGAGGAVYEHSSVNKQLNKLFVNSTVCEHTTQASSVRKQTVNKR